MPNCFCEHCRAKGQARGIHVERARQGFQDLYEFVKGVQAGQAEARDGVLVEVLRHFLKYPEILGREYFQHESKEEVAKPMYGAIKMIKPAAQVGWHVYHRGTTWDAIYRAEMDYGEIARYSDWIKPVVYHDIAGPRIRRDLEGLSEGILRDFSPEQSLGMLYATMGYDAENGPTWDELPTRGLSAEYVYRETKRAVDGAAGQAAIYAGGEAYCPT